MASVRPRPETARIRVLCIAATGQSGSTILSRLLGELPGFVAVGEIGRIWDKGLSENISCSCGDPFSLCSFWTAVGDAAFGGWDRVDGGEVAELRRSLAFEPVPLKHAMALSLITHPNLSPAYERWLDRYLDEMLAVYEAIHEVSGGQIIVDSMKIPSHIYMMALRMHGVDVRVVHQVRDSRGYAFSQTKFVARQGSLEHRPHRGRRSPWKSATRWNWVNASFDHLAHHRSVPGTRLRYEDLTADPNRALAAIADVLRPNASPKGSRVHPRRGCRARPGSHRVGQPWSYASGGDPRAGGSTVDRPLLCPRPQARHGCDRPVAAPLRVPTRRLAVPPFFVGTCDPLGGGSPS